MQSFDGSGSSRLLLYPLVRVVRGRSCGCSRGLWTTSCGHRTRLRAHREDCAGGRRSGSCWCCLGGGGREWCGRVEELGEAVDEGKLTLIGEAREVEALSIPVNDITPPNASHEGNRIG